MAKQLPWQFTYITLVVEENGYSICFKGQEGSQANTHFKVAFVP